MKLRSISDAEDVRLRLLNPYGKLRIARIGARMQWMVMNFWKKIRLELGRTSRFPSGSVSRGYLVHLPLDDEDRIDRAALALKPHRATVRRYWSTDPDESGFVVPVEGGWKMRCNGSPDRALLLGGQAIRLGEQISVVEADGVVLPFRVAGIR